MRSLVHYGLAEDDEREILWCFQLLQGPKAPTESEKERALPTIEILRRMLRRGADALEHFYQVRRPEWVQLSPVMSVAAPRTVALECYGRLAQDFEPPHAEGEEFERFLTGDNGRRYAEWLAELERKYHEGTLNQREGWAYRDIVADAETYLRSLVESFYQTRDYLEREKERERRRSESEQRQRERTVVPQSYAPTRRRYGEVPPEPEVVVRKKRG